MVLKVGLEPTRLAAADFESAKSTDSIIRAYKTHSRSCSLPGGITDHYAFVDFGRIFLDLTLRPKTLFLVLFYLR